MQITNSELSYLVLKVLAAECVSLERKQNNPLNGAAGNQQSISELSVEFRSAVVLSLERICQNTISDNLFRIQVLTGDCVPLDNQKI